MRPTGENRKGTLVISIPTRDGLLVMADRLAIGGNDHRRFDIDKLIPVGTFTAIASTGANLYVTKSKGLGGSHWKREFDANRTTKSFFSGRELGGSLGNYMPDLASALAKDWINQFPLQAAREIAATEGGILFQELIYHFNQEAHAFECWWIVFYQIEEPAPKVDWKVNHAPAEAFQFALASNAGAQSVLLKLQTGDDLGLPSSEAQGLRSYLVNPPPANTITVTEAVRALASMFVVTTHHTPARAPHQVGSKVDAILLSPTTGISWMARTQQAKKLRTRNFKA